MLYQSEQKKIIIFKYIKLLCCINAMLEIIPLRIMCFIRCFDVPSVFRNKEVAKMHEVGIFIYKKTYNARNAITIHVT